MNHCNCRRSYNEALQITSVRTLLKKDRGGERVCADSDTHTHLLYSKFEIKRQQQTSVSQTEQSHINTSVRAAERTEKHPGEKRADLQGSASLLSPQSMWAGSKQRQTKLSIKQTNPNCVLRYTPGCC